MCRNPLYEAALAPKAVDEFEGRVGVGMMLRTGESRYAEPESEEGVRWIYFNSRPLTFSLVYQFEARWQRALDRAWRDDAKSIREHTLKTLPSILRNRGKDPMPVPESLKEALRSLKKPR